ncbi:MAG: hypothetical protein LC713_06185, partial [Actinobacteria bacterium]|nr:hypothetical protein [Actinomycetota bacterium]
PWRDRMYITGRTSNFHRRSEMRKNGALAVAAGRPEVLGEDRRTPVEEMARFQGTRQLVSAEADGVKAPQDRTDMVPRHALGAGLYAPLRVLISEEEAGRTCVEYDLPSSLTGRLGDERITQIARTLDRKPEELVGRAAGVEVAP